MSFGSLANLKCNIKYINSIFPFEHLKIDLFFILLLNANQVLTVDRTQNMQAVKTSLPNATF